jgi:hypothetical protein
MTGASDHTLGFEPAEQELADRLVDARPAPPAGFRGTLGRHLAQRDPGYGPRPERLRLVVAGYLGAGGLLIALVALGVS